MQPRSALLALGAIVTFTVPKQLSAETASDAEIGAGLEEVIVTARRRAEVLQDVPISVSTSSGETLERAGVVDIQALQYRIPSLAVTPTYSQRNVAAFALRGQRAQETQLFTDPPVGTYFAEVVQPRPYGFGNALYDLQSVQVLRGVQGTLFGRNMTGGAVLVEPKHPQLDVLSAEVRAIYGNYDTMELFGMTNVPIGDRVAVRLAGKMREREGWAREVTTGRDYDNQNYDTLRLSLLFEPTDTFKSRTILDWYRAREYGTAAFLTSVVMPSTLSNYENLRAAGLITTNVPAQFAAAQALFRQRRYSFDIGTGEGGSLDASGAPYEDVENYGVTNQATWKISDTLTLKNIAGYRRNTRDVVQDFDGIPAFLITPYQFARVSTYSEELQLQAEAFEKRLELIFGAFYFKEDGVDGAISNTLPQLALSGARLPQTTPAALFQITNPGEGSSTTYAAFAAGTYHFTDRLSASIGVRYNRDEREITVSPRRPQLSACQWDLDLATPGIQSVPIDRCSFSNDKNFHETTYDATLQYEPNRSVTFYGSFRHGFRAGGFSTRAQNEIALRPFLPELVDEYELGLKTTTRFAGGEITSALALFRQDGSDVQKQRSASIDVNGDGITDNVVTIVDNTAEQRNTGGEFELGFGTGDFNLTGFYSYTKIEILQGAATSTIGLPEIAQRGAPKHQAGLTGTLDMPIGNAGELALTANVTWRSEIFLDDFELQSRQPSYTLVNLRARWSQIAQSRLSIAAFATNVFDEEYRTGVLGLIAEGLGFQSSVYGEPRMYGLELGYKF
jgi:iron complex outermembrane recepter protein